MCAVQEVSAPTYFSVFRKHIGWEGEYGMSSVHIKHRVRYLKLLVVKFIVDFLFSILFYLFLHANSYC